MGDLHPPLIVTDPFLGAVGEKQGPGRAWRLYSRFPMLSHIVNADEDNIVFLEVPPNSNISIVVW